MPRRAFADYLRESLGQIEAGLPRVYARLVASLSALRILIDVNGEVVGIRVEGARIAIVDALANATITARTTRAEIVALADGARTLEEAVFEDRVLLWGSVEDLLLGLDALMIYLNGAARCPELSRLMDLFRQDATGSEP